MAKKQTGKALVKWDEELANLAKDSAKGIELPAGKFISIKSGKLSFAGAAVPGNELRAVIVGWTHENQYYDEDYDPDVPQTPACYAFGTEKDEMEPHSQCARKQCEQCARCPMNEFGSAEKGKGKACKNVLRVALIAENDLEDLSSVEVVYLKVPVMSVKNFLLYAKQKVAETIKRPYWAVVTTIGVVPDDKSQFRVTFDVGELIEDSSLFGPLKELWEKTMEGIDFPYVVQERAGKKKAPVKKSKFSRK
jgi:hypothetical protein